jgi:hypothetical protein
MDKVYRPGRDGAKNQMMSMAKPMKPKMAKPTMPVRTDKVYRPSLDGPKNPMMNPRMGAVRRMRGMK